VIPGDFDYDGKLDLLLVTQNSAGDSTQLLYYIQSNSSPYFGKLFTMRNEKIMN